MSTLGFIIPCLDADHRLWRAVFSVLSEQSIDKLIVVDDGSAEPIEPPADFKADKRLEIVRHETNRGAGAARNTGLEALETEWIGFLDADDFLIPQTLADRLAYACRLSESTDPGRMMVACGWIEREIKTSVSRTPNPSRHSSDFATGCWWSPGSAMLCHRSVFDPPDREPLRFDPSIRRLEDFDLGLRFGLQGGSLLVDGRIGAAIEPGGRATYPVVKRSAQMIATKHAGLQSAHPAFWSRMNAYLELELGVYAARDRRFATAAVHFAKSVMHRPRLTPHLSPGWKYGDVHNPATPETKVTD